MFGNWPLSHRHWNGLLISRIWLAGQIQWLELLLSGILFPGHTHCSGLLVSRTSSPGQKHSSGWLGLGTWLPGQPGHRSQVIKHFFHTFFLLHLFFFFHFLHFLGLFLSLHLPRLNSTFFSEIQNNNFQLSISILSFTEYSSKNSWLFLYFAFHKFHKEPKITKCQYPLYKNGPYDKMTSSLIWNVQC